jgi:uncharacterized protein YutE (UPF0331/DUF86 family)
MDRRVTEHLQRLVQYLNELEDIGKTPKNQFSENNLLIAASERYLQLAIESCINIGNRIISLEQFNKPIKAPESYSDIFIQLERAGLINRELSENLIKMTRFRNRLVHVYWDVDALTLHEYLNNNIQDFHDFIRQVNDFFLSGEND